MNEIEEYNENGFDEKNNTVKLLPIGTENDMLYNDDDRIKIDIFDSPSLLLNDNREDVELKFVFDFYETYIFFNVSSRKNRNGETYIQLDCLHYQGNEKEANETIENWMMWIEVIRLSPDIKDLLIQSIGINDIISRGIGCTVKKNSNWKIYHGAILTIASLSK